MVVICLFGAPFYSRWRAANGRSGKYGLGTYLGAVILAVMYVGAGIVPFEFNLADHILTSHEQ